MDNEVYDKDVIEFVTVAAEFCVRLERAQETPFAPFVSDFLKVLPLLYVKATVLHDKQLEPDDTDVEQFVTEDDYDFVRNGVAALLGSHDDYLDVLVEEMKYSDRPIRRTISEDLADVYQDLRNFVSNFKQGYSETMNAALQQVLAQFPTYWGPRTLSALRALHDVMYLQEIEPDNDDTTRF